MEENTCSSVHCTTLFPRGFQKKSYPLREYFRPNLVSIECGLLFLKTVEYIYPLIHWTEENLKLGSTEEALKLGWTEEAQKRRTQNKKKKEA